jgi:dolichyl-phosphate-mannose-protein mannosyltransferase
MQRLKAAAPWLAILLVAAAVRLPALTASLPYLGYVDEGHVLHHVVHHLVKGTWEPDTYSYPSLPFYVVAAAAAVYSPVYAGLHGHSLRRDLGSTTPWTYDIVQPVDFLFLGRLVTLAFSLGLVLLTGLLARRVAGPPAGWLAAGLAALTPALVARGTVVNINPMMVFFVLAALLFAEGAREGGSPRHDAMLAGAMAGLAAASKYPAALVCLAVGLAVLLSQAAWGEKLRRLFLAGAAAVAACVAAMPALVLRPVDVLHGLQRMDRVYGRQQMGSYWQQAVHRAEWDLPLEHPEVGIAFLVLAAAGLGVGLLDRRWRRPVWGWLLFGAATGLLVAPYKFRAFRNLLALVPLGCILIALLYARIRRAVPRPLLVDVAAALLPIILFAPALTSYVGDQLALEDSREQAVRWLGEHTGAGDTVLVLEELAITPARLATVEAQVDVKPWDRAKRRIVKRNVEYLVLGSLVQRSGKARVPAERGRRILQGYAAVATFGSEPTKMSRGAFKGNRQLITILRRLPAGAVSGTAAGRNAATPMDITATSRATAQGALILR